MFQPKSYGDFILAGQGFLPFVIFWLVLFSSLKDFNQDIKEIRFSKFYLSLFAKPAHAFSLWLIIRFYLGLLSGLFLVLYSAKSLSDTCSLDLMLLVSFEPGIYVGKYMGEARDLLMQNFIITAILAFISYTLAYLVAAIKPALTYAANSKKDKEIVHLVPNNVGPVNILQSFFLVGTSSCLLLASSFGYQLTMLSFLNTFLLDSILASVIGLIDTSNVNLNLRLINKYAKNWLYLDKNPFVSKNQILSSMASFISFTYFLYWCQFYNNCTLKGEFGSSARQAISSLASIEITVGIHVFFIILWCYLSFRFIRFTANYNYNLNEPNI